jgi:hypothetical protein
MASAPSAGTAGRRRGQPLTATRATEPIDVTDDRVEILVEPQPEGHGPKGLPDPCPQCGGSGYLDRIKVSAKHQSCLACGHRWSVEVERHAAAEVVASYGWASRTGLSERLPLGR